MEDPGLVGEEKTGEAAEGSERRKQQRFECDGWAEVFVDDAALLFRGKIQDFSLTGCYVGSRARLSLDRGTTVELRFYVDGEYFNAVARIMSVRPGTGAGFEFLTDNPELHSRLMQLIDKLSAPTEAQAALADPTVAIPEEGPRRNLW